MNTDVLTTCSSTPEQEYNRSKSDSTVVTIPSRTTALLRGLDLIVDHHHASCEIRSALNDQVHAYLDKSSTETVWVKNAKWLLSYPLAKYLRNATPSLPPAGAFTPTGCLRAWMRQRLISFCRRNTHLWYSWFQAKRACLPASDDFIEDVYRDHFTTLSSDDPGVDSTIDLIFADPTFQSVLDKVAADLAKPFSNHYLDHSASSSASFESTRSNGGQHGELRRMASFSPLAGYELSRMTWFPVLHCSRRLTNVTWEFSRPEGEERWFLLHYSRHILPMPLNCTIQGVIEPLKVRVISKGESLPYYQAKPIQKALHNSLRNMDCFRLIGRPLSPCDALDLRESACDTWEWLSIDYSAATDGLSWKYSKRILQSVLRFLPISQQCLALDVLGPHRLHYPVKGRPVYRGSQRNGQLMGSILSFPILCLANLGVYLLNSQGFTQGWSDRKRLRHVLVNGDDMVYAAPKAFYDSHTRISGEVGLKMSVGKAYCHPEYFNVNSTSLHLRIRDSSTPWVVPYLNSGLFFGQHKVLATTETAESHHDFEGGLVENLNVVLGGSLPGRQGDLLKVFLRTHREEILRETEVAVKLPGQRSCIVHRNLFLPKSSGGCGVEAPVGFAFDITSLDRQIAAARAKCSANRSYGLPLPGYLVEKIDAVDEVPWSKPMSDDEGFYFRGRWFEKVLRLTRRRVSPWKSLLPVFHWSSCPQYRC